MTNKMRPSASHMIERLELSRCHNKVLSHKREEWYTVYGIKSIDAVYHMLLPVRQSDGLAPGRCHIPLIKEGAAFGPSEGQVTMRSLLPCISSRTWAAVRLMRGGTWCTVPEATAIGRVLVRGRKGGAGWWSHIQSHLVIGQAQMELLCCQEGPEPYILPPSERPSLQTSCTNKEPYRLLAWGPIHHPCSNPEKEYFTIWLHLCVDSQMHSTPSISQEVTVPYPHSHKTMQLSQ